MPSLEQVLERFPDQRFLIDVKDGKDGALLAGVRRWSKSFDSIDSLCSIPKGLAGIIWTSRIERISQALKKRGARPLCPAALP